jgi:hypothetical protein
LKPVRWKLVVITSLVAVVTGLGLGLGLTLLVLRLSGRFNFFHPLVVIASLMPLAAAITAGVFVYRHTARRRKLQAFLTIALSMLIQLAVLLGVPFYLDRNLGSLRLTRLAPPTPGATRSAPARAARRL